jgi:hypothetical protein
MMSNDTQQLDGANPDALSSEVVRGGVRARIGATALFVGVEQFIGKANKLKTLD